MSRSELPSLPATLTRVELHELVWRTPMMHLAEHFGLSGNGLAKICARMEIPVPPRGYWAKKAAGHKVAIAKLPTRPHAALASITLNRAPRPAMDGASPRKIAEQLAATIEILVLDRLTRPHHIIAGWLEDHERRKREAKRERDSWLRDMQMPAELTGQDRRQHRILDGLFKALERHGATVSQNDRRTLLVEVDDQKIEFGLREKLTQTRRPLTEREKQWESWNKSGMKTDLQGSGFLIFSIKSYLVGDLKREWLEKTGKSLESMLPQIAATMLIAAPLLKEQARRRAEDAQRLAIEQRRREDERLQEKRNRNQIRRLVELSSAWREFEIAREFLQALEQSEYNPAEIVGDKSIRDWIDWARQEINQQDTLQRGAKAVFSDMAQITNWTYRD